MRDVMEAFTQSNISRVVLKSSSQIGKSEAILNVLGRFAHLDPCPILMIQPTLEMAQDFSKSRISKMITDTRVLTPLFSDNDKTRNANQTILSKFFIGGRVVLAGANSPAGLASRPIRILLCDEVDRYPQSAGNEGDPISIAAKRTTTYWNSKIGIFSTPTTEGISRIDIEYYSGTQEEWRHKCPNCGEFHTLDYRQMNCEYDELADEIGRKVVIVKSVNWKCPDCGFEYDEMTMKNASQKYVAQNPDAESNGIRSFWVNGFSSPWLTWQDIMREYYEAKGNPSLEAVVHNTRFGLSYRQAGEFSDENVFMNRREEYGSELPEGVLILTAAVDVQDNRLEYEICGWGVDEECFGIVKGVILGAPNFPATWDNLDEVLDREYHFKDGTALKVMRTFVDSGGHFTGNVYEYCRVRAARGRFAIKGKGGDGLNLIHKISRVSNVPVPVVILGVNEGKQQVMNRLAIETTGANYFHYPLEDRAFEYSRGYDLVYFKGLISERRSVKMTNGIIRVIWEPIDRTTRNEPLDLRVYNLAAIQSCRVDWHRQATASESQAEGRRQLRKLNTREANLWN